MSDSSRPGRRSAGGCGETCTTGWGLRSPASRSAWTRSRRTTGQDPEAAAALAEQLKREVHASLADVRRLVEDLRPPALDQLGLVGAVLQHGQRLTERDPGLEVAVVANQVPPLPAAVEVAAYRIASEALNNVSRHAGARNCRVGIALDAGGSLVVEIEDDGVGLPPRPPPASA